MEQQEECLADECRLASMDPEELTRITVEAIDSGNSYEAFHAANHHLLNCHVHVDLDQVMFLMDNNDGINQGLQASCTHIHEQFVAHTIEQAGEAGGAPAIIQMMMGTDELKQNVLMGMSMTWIVGGHLAAYVASRGQHCLFGMIDPELCKENML